jgi:hypothetical protein
MNKEEKRVERRVEKKVKDKEVLKLLKSCFKTMSLLIRY